MTRTITETVQLSRFVGGAEDAHGNPVESWAAPVPIGVYAFNPGTTGEPFLPGHDRTITSPAIYAPTGTVFAPRDQVTVRGVLYDVDGVVLDYQNPYDASMDGVQVGLKAVDG